MEKAYLTVKEIDISDVGKGIAKIDPVVFEKLGLTTGDTIKIQGIKTTKSAIAYAIKGKISDTGLNSICLDATLRFNAGTKIDEEVTIEKTVCQIANSITLSPSDESSDLKRQDVLAYIKDRLLNKNIIEQNTVIIPGIKMVTKTGEQRDLQLTVIKTLPKGAVMITPETKITITDKPEEANKLGITYDDIGGLKKEIESIREMVELPIKRPEIFKKLGISAPKGILLYGPPGTGKTLLAKAVASETDSNFQIINGPEIVSGVYGQSEENLRKIFKEAEEKAPSIIFIDEIDAIAPKRENIHGETEKRIVAQLLTLMDGLKTRGDVVVIGATNIPDSLDPALRRPGRFDREIEINIPTKDARKEILLVHTRGMPLVNVNLDKIIEYTNGFSGADISALCKEAALKALKRLIPLINKETGNHLSKEIMDKLIITQEDFSDALNVVEPSAIREIMVTIPNTKWDAVGGLENIKQELKEMIEWPMKHKTLFEDVGVQAPRGVLLYGLPGTGKTLLAKAIATEANANFISVKGPEIYNKWVGESEKKIRDIFKKARQLAPSIIFIDEIDSITGTRYGEIGNEAKNNVVAQLLTEIDGVSNLKDIVIIGATNRIDMVDSAFLRPGRFEKILLVPLPDLKTREKIFEVYINKMNVDSQIKISQLAKETEGFSGADIEAICREAGLSEIRTIVEKTEKNKKLKTKPIVSKTAFLKAIEKFKKKNEKTEKTDSAIS
jgi:transitional endoplasmic reticulum ATPase